MEDPNFLPFDMNNKIDPKAMIPLSQANFESVSKRRSLRKFSSQAVPREVIENCIRSAGTAPSGANKQPWLFAVIESLSAKRRIREAAEEEEFQFYSKRAPQNWLNDLKKFKTNAHKPYLESAPFLIAIFFKLFEDPEQRQQSKTYYPKESVGIATGLLINALHNCGLSSLTHTPSPMNFLNTELGLCKKQYRPFLLLVTGFPGEKAEVPVLNRKPLDKIARFY